MMLEGHIENNGFFAAPDAADRRRRYAALPRAYAAREPVCFEALCLSTVSNQASKWVER